MQQFFEDIKVLTPTTINRAVVAIADKEEALFFIGRATCPYCRRFATKLAAVVARTGAQVYFTNSEEVGQEAELAAFRTQYKIPTVPGFVHIKDGKVEVRCDSSMTEDEIQAFMA